MRVEKFGLATVEVHNDNIPFRSTNDKPQLWGRIMAEGSRDGFSIWQR